jgi:hypothetical protein
MAWRGTDCQCVTFTLLANPSAGANTPPPNTWGSLFVAADAGSTYEPYPTLKYRWNPRRSVRHSLSRQYSVHGPQGVDLGPHPADPMAVHDGSQVEDEHLEGPNIMERRAPGTDIYVYSGRGGYAPVLHVSTPTWLSIYVYLDTISTYTFWRFLIQIQLTENEMKIQYSINDGLKMDFFVPSNRETMRLAAYSVSELNPHHATAS